MKRKGEMKMLLICVALILTLVMLYSGLQMLELAVFSGAVRNKVG